MCDLIDDAWLANHMDEHGDYPIDWTDEQKDEAANQALHKCKNSARRNELLGDFWDNYDAIPLYSELMSDYEKNNETKNNIWRYLESEIIAQCAAIVETRGWKE
jgi:hypothetical protein